MAPLLSGLVRAITPPAQRDRADSAADIPLGVRPRDRKDDSGQVNATNALNMHAIYRAVDVIATGITQLSIKIDRNGSPIPDSDIPSIIKTPSLSMNRRDFIEEWVTSLALNGNSYVRVYRDSKGRPGDLEVLPPNEVRPDRENRRAVFHYGGTKYRDTHILHSRLMAQPGSLTGLGPIQAAATELSAAAETIRYATRWTETAQPSGILSADNELTEADAKRARDIWNNLDENGQPLPAANNPSRVKVLGKGLRYAPLYLSPKDIQWIESRELSTTMVARLFGVPAPLMMAAVDGSSMTYSNVEQEWIALTRFTLVKYLNKMSDALTTLVPRGQRVRLNIDALLRADTKTRYEAHAIALDKGFLTIDEVRALENRPAL